MSSVQPDGFGAEIKLDGYTCLKPDEIIAHLHDQGRPTNHIQGYANKFILPEGREYGRGSVLLTAWGVRNILKDFGGDGQQTEAEHTDPYRFHHILRFEDRIGSKFEIKNLGIVRVAALTGFNEHHYNNDPPERSILYVRVDLADARYIARYSAIDRVYNVRSRDSLTWGYGNSYYKPSLSFGVPWTWQNVVTDLFDSLPAAMKLYTLDNSGLYPTSNPENLIFRGMSAWDAICTILEDTGNVIYRTAEGGTWRISPKAETQGHTGLRRNRKQFINDPTWDYPMESAKAIHIPETIRVYFPTNFSDFQSITDDGGGMSRIVTGRDAWLNRPLVQFDIPTNSIFDDPESPGIGYFQEGTVLALHSDMVANYDEVGNELNYAALLVRAEEIAEGWIARNNWEFKNSLHTIYNYFHSAFQPGSEISAVAWYNEGYGSRTEVLLSPLHFNPKDELGFIGENSVQDTLGWEIHAPPDVARHHGPDDGFLVGTVYADSRDGKAFLVHVLTGQHTGTDTIGWQEDPDKLVYVFPLDKANYCDGEKILAWWHQQTRRWVTHRDLPFLAYGTFDQKMCISDYTVTDTQRTNALSCETINQNITLTNDYSLAAKQGDRWLALKNCNSCSTWSVIQVQHQSELVVIAEQFGQTYGCTNSYPNYEVTVPNQDCTITYGYRENAVMYCDSTVRRGTLARFTATLVMVDWFIQGLIFYGRYEWIYVPCVCTPFTDIIHIGVDCLVGSTPGTGPTIPIDPYETFVGMEPHVPGTGPGGPWKIP